MRELVHNLVAQRAAALALSIASFINVARAQEPISFVLPAANFQPVPADAYRDAPTPPQAPMPPANSLTPPSHAPTPTPAEMVSPEATDTEQYMPTDESEPLECPNCHGGSGGGNYLQSRLPNGQIPDDWMWGCGQWPYANGPGTCDDWKVGPIWDVTVDGMVMTREHTDLGALQSAMAQPGTPEVIEQFDRAPGGRVYLTGLMPKSAGYQMFAGYEGNEQWNAAIVYPEQPSAFPAFSTVTERRSLYYSSSLQSGELNFLRMCDPAWRPYCGVRYIKFSDEIWDSIEQNALPPLPDDPPITVTTENALNIFNLQNNLIGFQGGVKYDVWQFGKRFSLQGFMNGGVYYNRAKWSNLSETAQTQFVGDDTSLPGDQSTASSSTASNLTIIEESNVAYVGEASLTGVCRLNKCWACRFGYQVLFIDGVHLASDAYLNSTIDERSMIFHGWHAGVECRR